MPTMNETSTITLPECHNLLALLLLSLNTPLVSSSSTTQEELKKKERRENTHTEPGARQQNGAGRQVPDPDKETDLTHKTHYQKERRVSHQKKKDRQNQSTTTSTQTQTTCMREESHTKGKTKKKNHTTHSRLTSQHHPATWHTDSQSNPQRHTLNLSSYSYPHSPSTSLLSPMPTPYPHTAHTSTNTFLHTYAHPATTHRHCTTTHVYTIARNCTHVCLGLATARPQLVFRSLTVATPCHRLATTARLYRLLSHCCLHTVHMSVCTTVLTLLSSCRHFGFSHCAHHDPSFSPSVCYPGCLRYHQSLTRVHSHSLPAPPPLPLADARSQGGSTVGRSRSLACGLWCPLVLCGSPCW